LNTTVAQKLNEEQMKRISGKTRYDTAVEISKNGWTKSETVILAIGNNFPDALAYKLNAPILLTGKEKLGESTNSEIKRLGAKKAIILGSVGVITSRVEQELKGLGLSVRRIGGNTALKQQH
jgi:putative cell wall-binding protein